jgi:hypothetical protein
MVAAILRFEDRLGGAYNFVPWKARVTLVLVENGLLDFSNTNVTPPIDPKYLATYELKEMKFKRIILDLVKDHLILHIYEKNSSKERFVAPKNHFQKNNANRKMVLREKLIDTKMIRSDRVTIYLTKITQVHDQLEIVGEFMLDEYFVRKNLNGFSKPWVPFIKGIMGWETLPKFDRIWDDFIQEEI